MRCRCRAVLPLAMNARFDIDQFGLALFRFCDPSQPPLRSGAAGQGTPRCEAVLAARLCGAEWGRRYA